MALGPKWYCFHSRACIYAWCVEVVRILTVEFRPTLKNTSMSHRYRLKQCFTSAGEGDLSKGFKVLSPGKEMMIKMTKTGNKKHQLGSGFPVRTTKSTKHLGLFHKNILENPTFDLKLSKSSTGECKSRIAFSSKIVANIRVALQKQTANLWIVPWKLAIKLTQIRPHSLRPFEELHQFMASWREGKKLRWARGIYRHQPEPADGRECDDFSENVDTVTRWHGGWWVLQPYCLMEKLVAPVTFWTIPPGWRLAGVCSLVASWILVNTGYGKILSMAVPTELKAKPLNEEVVFALKWKSSFGASCYFVRFHWYWIGTELRDISERSSIHPLWPCCSSHKVGPKDFEGIHDAGYRPYLMDFWEQNSVAQMHLLSFRTSSFGFSCWISKQYPAICHHVRRVAIVNGRTNYHSTTLGTNY